MALAAQKCASESVVGWHWAEIEVQSRKVAPHLGAQRAGGVKLALPADLRFPVVLQCRFKRLHAGVCAGVEQGGDELGRALRERVEGEQLDQRAAGRGVGRDVSVTRSDSPLASMLSDT